MNDKVKSEIGMLILTEETLTRNRNRMIYYLGRGDIEGARALIQMQKNDWLRYIEYLNNIDKFINEPALKTEST